MNLKTEKILSLLKVNGRRADEVLTQGQKEIFSSLVFREKNRLQIITPTQYGKSLTVALAVEIITCIQDEIVAIVAPTNEKAKIIMRYYIEHLGDNILFYSQLDKNSRLDKLRMEESKERIILRNGGGIYVLSVQAGNSIKGIEAAIGEGAKVVILDEASLTPDNTEATVFRMIAGHKDGFYCKIGNPFYRNHFLKSWNDPKYKKVFVDYQQALAEGRLTHEFIEEAKTKPHFDVLFECKFPDEDKIDNKGFSRLITDKELEIALVELPQAVWFGERTMGIDIARGGGNFNVWTMRCENYATQLGKNEDNDLMSVAGTTIRLGKENDVRPENWFPDDIGTGGGVSDRLKEQNYHIRPVKFSEKASDERFENKRAECYWKLKQWIASGGKLNSKQNWSELKNIKYKAKDSSGKLLIMSKEDMKKEGNESPDIADSLANTFSDVIITKQSEEELKQAQKDDLDIYL